MGKATLPESPLLEVTANGLFCTRGGFYVDPWFPADRAIITHAHSDHARPGSKRYLTSAQGVPLLRARLGGDAAVEGLAYGKQIDLDGVLVSLHPAGHVLGSCQVRIEYAGEVWVVSGDYKLDADPTCVPFEVVRCHTFVTESTFGLPIYRWPPLVRVMEQIHDWWRANRESGRASILFAYSLGKAQRLLAALDPGIGPIWCHGAIERLNRVYRESGVVLPPARYTGSAEKGYDWSEALVLAPPSCRGTPWMRRFGDASAAFASGWMRLRGTRRRQSLDRGFVCSDHADWPGLLRAIEATGAERILVTHGYRAPMVRWLEERGLQARALETRFEGERAESTEEPELDIEATPEGPE